MKKMVHKETKDTISDKVKEKEYDKLTALLLKKPEKLPEDVAIKALFVGVDSTGKSGTALSLLDGLEDDERLLLVDLEKGNKPLAVNYHSEDYLNGKLMLHDPKVWKEIPSLDGETDKVIDFKETVKAIKRLAHWVEKNNKEFKIKGVILDGLSTLLNEAEFQNPLEKNMQNNGEVSQKYWSQRTKDFGEMLQLYKDLPMDVVFVGNADFKIDALDKGVSKVYKEVNDMVYQKVFFEKEETSKHVRFSAKIEKAKQNIKSNGRVVKFGEVDTQNPEADYWWDPSELIQLLRPDRQAKNKARG
jgi:hypothetical protein